MFFEKIQIFNKKVYFFIKNGYGTLSYSVILSLQLPSSPFNLPHTRKAY